jgi:hypothetical protein
LPAETGAASAQDFNPMSNDLATQRRFPSVFKFTLPEAVVSAILLILSIPLIL